MRKLSLLVAVLLTVSFAYAGTLYVDNTYSGGGSTGTQTNPYSTIESAISASVSGDTIRVKATGVDYVNSSASGWDVFSPKEGTTLVGNWAGEGMAKCLGTGGLTVFTVNYSNTTIDGFAMDAGSVSEVMLFNNISNVTIQNCDIRGYSGSRGIYSGQDETQNITNMTITGNTIHDIGESGIEIRRNAEGLSINNNVFYSVGSGPDGGNAISLGTSGSDTVYVNNTSVVQNLIYDCTESGICITAAQGITEVLSNTVTGMGEYALEIPGYYVQDTFILENNILDGDIYNRTYIEGTRECDFTEEYNDITGTITVRDTGGQSDVLSATSTSADPLLDGSYLPGAEELINSGNNDEISWLYDLAGNDRIQGGTVDMGAYETDIVPEPTTLACIGFGACVSLIRRSRKK